MRNLEHLPMSIQSKFTSTYEGFKAAKFTSLREARDFQISLAWLNVPHKAVIAKPKRDAVQYYVLFLGGANAV